MLWAIKKICIGVAEFIMNLSKEISTFCQRWVKRKCVFNNCKGFFFSFFFFKHMFTSLLAILEDYSFGVVCELEPVLNRPL